MEDDEKTQRNSRVDKSLIGLFLKMSPEERLLANDNAVRAIVEMRNAYKQRISKPRSERDH